MAPAKRSVCQRCYVKNQVGAWLKHRVVWQGGMSCSRLSSCHEMSAWINGQAHQSFHSPLRSSCHDLQPLPQLPNLVWSAIAEAADNRSLGCLAAAIPQSNCSRGVLYDAWKTRWILFKAISGTAATSFRQHPASLYPLWLRADGSGQVMLRLQKMPWNNSNDMPFRPACDASYIRL